VALSAKGTVFANHFVGWQCGRADSVFHRRPWGHEQSRRQGQLYDHSMGICVPQSITVFILFDIEQGSFKTMAQATRNSQCNHPNLENIDPSHIYYIHSKAAKFHHSTLYDQDRLKLKPISVNKTRFRIGCPSHARCKPCPPRVQKNPAEAVLLKLYGQLNAVRQGMRPMDAENKNMSRSR
jgi:hypothetical protein